MAIRRLGTVEEVYGSGNATATLPAGVRRLGTVDEVYGKAPDDPQPPVQGNVALPKPYANPRDRYNAARGMPVHPSAPLIGENEAPPPMHPLADMPNAIIPLDEESPKPHTAASMAQQTAMPPDASLSHGFATAAVADMRKREGDDPTKWSDQSKSALIDSMVSLAGNDSKVDPWIADLAPRLFGKEKPYDGKYAILPKQGWRHLTDRKAAELGLLPGKPDQYSDKKERWYKLGGYASQAEEAQARKLAAEINLGGVQDYAVTRATSSVVKGAQSAVYGLVRAITPEHVLPGVADTLDEANRNLSAQGGVLADKSGVVGGVVNQAAQTLGQMAPGIAISAATGGAAAPYVIPATIGAQTYGQSLTAGRDAGLRGEALTSFAAKQAAAEAVPELIFSALGAPGAEALLTRITGKAVTEATKRAAVKNIMAQAGKVVGIGALQEVPPELLTQAIQRGIDESAGIKHDQPLSEELLNTGIVAAIVGAAANTPRAILHSKETLGQWVSAHPDKAEAIAKIQEPSRANLEEAGLDAKDSTLAERKKVVGQVRRELPKIKIGDIRNNDSVVLSDGSKGTVLATRNGQITVDIEGVGQSIVPIKSISEFSRPKDAVAAESADKPLAGVAYDNRRPGEIEILSEGKNGYVIARNKEGRVYHVLARHVSVPAEGGLVPWVAYRRQLTPTAAATPEAGPSEDFAKPMGGSLAGSGRHEVNVDAIAPQNETNGQPPDGGAPSNALDERQTQATNESNLTAEQRQANDNSSQNEIGVSNPEQANTIGQTNPTQTTKTEVPPPNEAAVVDASAKPAITRADLVRAVPGQNVVEVSPGSYRVEFQNGSFITTTPQLPEARTRANAEASVGRPLSDAEFAAFRPTAAFKITDDAGRSANGFGLLYLSNSAKPEHLDHELIHAAHTAGLFHEGESRSLANKYAPESFAATKEDAERIVNERRAKQGKPPIKVDDATFAGMKKAIYVEERIAEAYQKWAPQKKAKFLDRLKELLRNFLSRFGIVDPTPDGAFARVKSGEIWGRRANPETRQEAVARLSGDVRYAAEDNGRRPPANIGVSPQAREFVAQQDQTRIDAGLPEPKPDEMTQAAADELLKNPTKLYDDVLKRADQKAQLTDAETNAAKQLINNIYESGKTAEAVKLLDAYRRTGTEQGRAFRQRHDPLNESPVQRRKREFNELMLEPDGKTQKKINKLRGEADALDKKGKKAEAGKKRTEADKLLEKYAKEIDKLKEELKSVGMDVDNLDAIVQDPFKAAELQRQLSTMKADKWDVLWEYFNFSVLSGPTTAVANIAGNAANIAVVRPAVKFVERMLNTVVRDPSAPQFGDLKYGLAGIIPGIRRGVRNAIMSWHLEQPVEGGYYKWETRSRAAIKGMKGRIMRAFSWRQLLAADQLFKSMAAQIEVGEIAYRMAKEEGLEGESLAARINELTADPKSDAWATAKHEADVATFQEEGSEFRQKVKQAAMAARRVPGVRYVIPFVNFGINLGAQTAQFHPLNMLRIAWKMKENGGSIKGLTEPIAKQMIAMAVMFAMDDDWITGGDDREHPYSIKIGDNWYSYVYIAPLGPILGMLADTKSGFFTGDPTTPIVAPVKTLIDQVDELPALKGLQDVMRIIAAAKGDAQESSERGRFYAGNTTAAALEWASSFATSWVPNIVKAPLRASREFVPERRQWGGSADPEQALGRLGKRTLQRTEALSPGDLPKYDLWGREKKTGPFASPLTNFVYRLLVPMRANVGGVHPGDEMIANWNSQLNVKPFKTPSLRNYYTEGGKTHSMTDEEYARYTKLAGQIAATAFSEIKFNIDKPTAADMGVLKDVLSGAAETARELIKKERVGPTQPIDTTNAAASIVRKRRLSLFHELSEKISVSPKAGEAREQFMERFGKERARRLQLQGELKILKGD